MEMFAVFALGYVAARLQRNPTAARLAVVATVLVAYFAFKLQAIVSTHETSLYSLAGVSRSLRSEDLRRLYRTLAREKHPDKNPGEQAETEFVAFQRAFETLEDHGYRQRYELYGAVGEEAAANSLLTAAPFYIGVAVMAYCLTCEKESLIAGRAALVAVIALGIWEWKAKRGAQDPLLGYAWMPLSTYEQFEAVRQLFYPLLLGVYCVSAHFHNRSAARKASRLQNLLQDLQANTAAFRQLQREDQASSDDIDQAVLRNSRIGQLAAEQLSSIGQKKSKWKTFVSVAIFLGIWYCTSSSVQVSEEHS